MTVTNPRRTTKNSSMTMTPPSSSLEVMAAMPLKKSATFHSPSTSTAESALKTPSPPRRSQTSLDDVVESYKRRAALTLRDIDHGLSSVDLDSTSPVKPSFRDEALPVPQGFLNHTVAAGLAEGQKNAMTNEVAQEPADYNVGGRSLRPRRHIRRPSHYHSSDSGLGSSVMSGSGKRTLVTGLTAPESQCGKSAVTASAITRSAAAHKSTLDSLPRLTDRATSKIHEYILRPLLAKSSLKDFHPVVEDCPRKITEKEIVCLRDLEKTLIFMAPVSDVQIDVFGGVTHWLSRYLKERSKSAKEYLDFCITSIRCIQATVEFLSEREQTRPHDRPYTNGYFVDLVDQIRNYARQMQASKEKEEKGEPLDEMDVESSEEVKLYGGLTRNGHPAELVRVKKNGKAISIATGEQIKIESIEEDEKGSVQMKRSLSQEAADDEAIHRSMARRKRSASAAELAPKKCREPGCTKEFKRSCDLTKHEKTHSRPWKCPEELCKYHEYGWPTEKELDRHINDKHSASPMLYKCQFAPCPYKSKRESNCKQHMEKSHNWVYVRSKNNGKNRGGNSKAGDSSLPTPQTLNHRTPDSSDSHEDPTPEDDYTFHPYTGSSSVHFDQPIYEVPNYPELLTDDFMYDNGQFISPVESHNQGGSISSSEHTSPFLDGGNHGFPADNCHSNFDPNFVNGTDFALYDDIYNARVQIPTPASIFQQQLDIDTFMNPAPVKADPVPHISPGGHGNTMLYTPTSMNAVDDSFEHFEQDNTQLRNDFQLFSNTGANILGGTHRHGNTLFGEVPSTVAGFSQPNTQEFFQAFYAPHNPAGAEWLQPDEGYSGGFDNQ